MKLKLKRDLPLAVLIFSACAFIAVGNAVSTKGGLVFLNTHWNIGKVTSLKEQKHIFSFINSGKKSVAIQKLVSSCGCTAAVVSDKKMFLPGERGEILVTFNPVGHYGKLETAVRVYTDDLNAPPIKLYLKGSLPKARKGPIEVTIPHPRISVTPAKVNLGKLKKGQAAIYKVKVYNRGEGELRIINFDTMSEKGNQSLRQKAIKKDKGVELTAFYKATDTGKFKEYLVIRSNDPQKPIVRLEVTGVVVE